MRVPLLTSLDPRGVQALCVSAFTCVANRSQARGPKASTGPPGSLTTYELRDYRRDLERAIKEIPADAPVQAALRGKLDAALAEPDDRARLAAADA